MGADPIAFPPRVMEQLRERAGGHCEGCGRWSAHLEAHHRKFRSRGGLGTVDNGAMLCGWGNHTGCHGRAHGQGDPDVVEAQMGWSLARGENPLDVPFVDLRGEIWLFLADGTKIRASELAAAPVDPWQPAHAVDPWTL